MKRRNFFKLGLVSVLFPSVLAVDPEPKLDWVKVLKYYLNRNRIGDKAGVNGIPPAIIRRNDVYFIDDIGWADYDTQMAFMQLTCYRFHTVIELETDKENWIKWALK